MSTNKAATKADLQELYSRILPYLGGSADAGFTPVGTVISVMGNHAPANYLKCDGATYNIVDYPELADYFLAEFGQKNKFGGNGTTTFAVPDLQGEFLRGTGTNSHTNQGNGADVGTHQDSTEVPKSGIWKNGDGTYKLVVDIDKNVNPSSSAAGTNNDDTVSTGTGRAYVQNTSMTFMDQSASAMNNEVTVRPTNTSVLYCIATKNIYMNPSLDYSTSEKVVGTWIDSKPLYQKTWVVQSQVPSETTTRNQELFTLSGMNIEDVIDIVGTVKRPDGQIWKLNTFGFGSDNASSDNTNAYNTFVFCRIVNSLPSAIAFNTGSISSNYNVFKNSTFRVTLYYTKTTD